MIISLEVATNPGPNARFMAEAKLESSPSVGVDGWWGVWLGWWLLPFYLWREWLWVCEWNKEHGWTTLKVRLLGFEINIQGKKSKYASFLPI